MDSEGEKQMKKQSAKIAKERLIVDITPVESGTKWKDAPRHMLIRRAVIEAGEWGTILHGEIARLTDELTAKEAAVVVLMAENKKLEAALNRAANDDKIGFAQNGFEL